MNNNLKILYMKDRSVYRVWRNDWPSDMFETIEWQQFSQIEKFCALFSISLEEKEED